MGGKPGVDSLGEPTTDPNTMPTTTPRLSAATDPAAFFAEHGYYVARGLFRERIATLEREYDRIADQVVRSGEHANARDFWQGEAADRLSGRNTVTLHTHQVHSYSAPWLQAWMEPRFLDLAEGFLGPDIILHHTKLFRKPAEKGGAFPMHQDWSYFPVSNNRCLAAIVYVSDADDANGCLRLYPGSHHEGRIADSSGLGALSELQRRFPIDGSTVVDGKAGDVVFFHSLTIHGSMPNRSERVRKTVLVQLYSGSETIEQPGHGNSQLVLRGWNHRITPATAYGNTHSG